MSLGVALFFIPSLLDKIPLPLKRSARIIRRNRKTIKISRLYGNYISLGLRYRWILIMIAILGFGLPLFLVPEKLPVETDLRTYKINQNLQGSRSSITKRSVPEISIRR